MRHSIAHSLWLALGLVLIPLLPSALAETRTYTSSDGKKLEAEVMMVKEGNASLKLANGRTFKVPLSRLSEDDQTFLKEWAKENPAISMNSLRLEIRKSRKPVDLPKVTDKKKKARFSEKKSTIIWKGTLQNNTREPIEDVKVTYKIFRKDYYKSDTTNSTTVETTEEVEEVGSIAGGEKIEFESNPEYDHTKIDKGDKNTKGTTERSTVIGGVFTVMVKDRVLSTFEDPSGIVAKLDAERKREEEKEAREAERGR